MTGRGIMPPGRAHFCDLIEGVDDDRGEQTKGSVALYNPNHKQDREGRGTMARSKTGTLSRNLKEWLKVKVSGLHLTAGGEKGVDSRSPTALPESTRE